MERLPGARVSDDAAAGWDRALTVHGVTFSALMESLGLMLHERVDWVPEDAVARARQIQRDRERR